LIIGAALLAVLIPKGATAIDPDEDHDGVVNLADKCPNTSKGVRVDKVGCVPEDTGGDDARDESEKRESQRAACRPSASIAAALGVNRNQLLLGEKVKWDKAPEAQPRNAFSKTELSSKGKLKSYLNDNDRGSRETRKLLKDDLSNAQYKRALTGTGWLPVQIKGGVTISLPDNFQLIDQKVVKRGSTSQPDEVLWVYVPSDCSGDNVAITIAVRGWCGNPQVFTRE